MMLNLLLSASFAAKPTYLDISSLLYVFSNESKSIVFIDFFLLKVHSLAPYSVKRFLLVSTFLYASELRYVK
jgi:hypothetical protein